MTCLPQKTCGLSGPISVPRWSSPLSTSHPPRGILKPKCKQGPLLNRIYVLHHVRCVAGQTSALCHGKTRGCDRAASRSRQKSVTRVSLLAGQVWFIRVVRFIRTLEGAVLISAALLRGNRDHFRDITTNPRGMDANFFDVWVGAIEVWTRRRPTGDEKTSSSTLSSMESLVNFWRVVHRRLEGRRSGESLHPRVRTKIHVRGEWEHCWGWAHFYLRIENAKGYVLIAVYLFICMRVTCITQKVLNRIAWNLVGWLVFIRGPFD